MRIVILSLHCGFDMEVVLIRHTSVDVPSGTCYGQSDVPLLASFPEEAARTRKALEAFLPFDAVYTSPLSRCVRLAMWCGYPDAIRDDRLKELNFGVWEMQRYEEIDDPRIDEWYADYLHVAPTGGESFVEQMQRISQFLNELRNRVYRRVALFTHGGSIACAQIYAGQINMQEAFTHIPAYGEIVRITI